jgi:hypothetical protein
MRPPLEEARDPLTPPERLEALAGQGGAVQTAVAQNPNTPPAVLLELIAVEPEAVLQNEVFPLLLLENPVLLAATPMPALKRVLTESGPVPRRAELLQAAAAHSDSGVRALVAIHPSTPPELLARLARDPSLYVRERVASNYKTPPELLSLLARDGEQRVRQVVAGHFATPPEALELLRQDPDQGVRLKIWRRLKR